MRLSDLLVVTLMVVILDLAGCSDLQEAKATCEALAAKVPEIEALLSECVANSAELGDKLDELNATAGALLDAGCP